MVAQVLRKIIGTRNDRQIRRMGRFVERINDLEAEIQALPDEAFKSKTEGSADS